MDIEQLRNIVEAALLAAGRPLNLGELQALFGEEHPPAKDDLRAAIQRLQADYEHRGIAVQEVASGFRIQVRPSMSGWLGKLWEERAPRYSRALMETLAIIVYRQPVTRGDVEEIRGVGVTTNIMRSLLERNWIRVVGFRDVPGKPAMYGTTKEFLDYFGLRRLDDLPPLGDIKDLGSLMAQLDLGGDSAVASPGLPPPLIQLADEADTGVLATVTPITGARPDESGVEELGPDDGRESQMATVIPLNAR